MARRPLFVNRNLRRRIFLLIQPPLDQVPASRPQFTPHHECIRPLLTTHLSVDHILPITSDPTNLEIHHPVTIPPKSRVIARLLPTQGILQALQITQESLEDYLLGLLRDQAANPRLIKECLDRWKWDDHLVLKRHTDDVTRWADLHLAWNTTPNELACDLTPTKTAIEQNANEWAKLSSASAKEGNAHILAVTQEDTRYILVTMVIANLLETLYRTADLQIATPENETRVTLRAGILEISESEIREMVNGVAWALTPAIEPLWITNDRIPTIHLLPRLILLMALLTQVLHPIDILHPRTLCQDRQAKACPMDPHPMTLPIELE